ncbi:MATE family efflux transporter, partial [Vallitalea sediminicola]
MIFVIFTHHIISAIGTSSGTYVYTKDYYQIIVSFSIILAIQVTLCGLVRSEGSTGKSMIGVILGNVVNIILDP